MKTISREATAAIEVNKSKFIGRSLRCMTVEDALIAVKRVRREYRDATHYCWAFRVGMSGDSARYDNSGEPQGTAGPPILSALKNASVTNTLIMVIRYYGGTKLGSGGLARAYGETAKRVLIESGLTELRLIKEIQVPVPYNLLPQMESYLARKRFEIVSREFGEHVVLILRIPSDREARFRIFYSGLVGGRTEFIVLGEK